ncbi:single-strand annealing protein [Vibrio phage 1.134.O._10N.222.52.B8]|nr:single-strand annealing protein [Vibrio phage 1.134.O._10N.222.52.B8]AUR91997.1 single-strand annealing protein [Vibrio phage 1.168.O._10N.261.52.A10]
MSNDIFKTLHAINVNGRTEKKGKLTYLSWAWAWAEVCKIYPDANYTVDEHDGKPYLYDENLGYLVSTKVTIDGKTIPMSLPVMDGANKAMKAISYSYKTKYGDKHVEPATMFDINKTMMRCLVKNLAMFGLGLYIYAGEDLPEPPPAKPINFDEVLEEFEVAADKAKTEEELKQLFAPAYKTLGASKTHQAKAKNHYDIRKSEIQVGEM